MGETFRDEANFERACRVLSSKRSDAQSLPDSEDVLSAKECLLINSVCHSLENHDAESGETEDQGRNEGVADLGEKEVLAGAAKPRKPSHRQRKRRQNYWTSVPRTPS